MEKLNELSKTLGGMPLESLGAIVILAAFALAAYTIYAAIAIAKERGKERR
jgi:hypothetical protein